MRLHRTGFIQICLMYIKKYYSGGKTYQPTYVRDEFLTVLAQILFLAGSFVVHITAKYPAEYYCVMHTLLEWTEPDALRNKPLILKCLYNLSYYSFDISDCIVSNCRKMEE